MVTDRRQARPVTVLSCCSGKADLVLENAGAKRPRLTLPEAVIFDMDGLIFDSETLYGEALLELARVKGLPNIDLAVARSMVGRSWTGSRLVLQALLPAHEDVDEFRSEWLTAYDELAETRLVMKPGVLELLTLFEQSGVSCGMATGSRRSVVSAHLAAHGLTDFFPVIIAAEDCREGKPAPEPFLKAAEALGKHPGNCWALEDSVNGVISASAAGMTTFMVPDLIEPDEETAARCTAVLSSLVELHAWLSR